MLLPDAAAVILNTVAAPAAAASATGRAGTASLVPLLRLDHSLPCGCPARLPSRTPCFPLGAHIRTACLPAQQAEGVRNIEPVAASSLSAEQDQTLLCFVLVDPEGRHAFCRCAGQLACATRAQRFAVGWMAHC